MNIKELRPQVLVGILVLGAMAYVAMAVGYDNLAGVAIGGIVAAVTSLAVNGKPSP